MESGLGRGKTKTVNPARRLLSLIGFAAVVNGAAAAEFLRVPLTNAITHVQPQTGIVLWDDDAEKAGDNIQLEYSYLKYSDVVTARDVYDWSKVERKLDAIARRGHQAVLRFYDTYVGQPAAVPAYLKALPDYHETAGRSEGKATGFPDWSHPELQRCVTEFYKNFAARYDRDPRLAFLETGFGLWAEYHIYDGPYEPGRTFPAKEFQAEFLRLMQASFRQTPWLVSVDAADPVYSPIPTNAALLALDFGTFDDSFLAAEHARVNEKNWDALGRDRWQSAPAGGEFSYYTRRDQKLALAENGPHGESFESAARRFHLTFIIGNDQPRHQKWPRIRAAGLACGYRFRVEEFATRDGASRVTMANIGIAPIYHDAFPAVNGVRAAQSLRGLLPGERRVFEIAAGGPDSRLTIESDRLAPGQRIEFEAGQITVTPKNESRLGNF